MKNLCRLSIVALAIGAALASPIAKVAVVNTLAGWALMPANIFADGPTPSQFASGAGGNPLPLINQPSVQGFLAGDPVKSLRINELSIDREPYTGPQWRTTATR